MGALGFNISSVWYNFLGLTEWAVLPPRRGAEGREGQLIAQNTERELIKIL